MKKPSVPLHIGLTGGIGSGKSTVAQILVQAGATLVDADDIVRQLTAPQGQAVPLIAAQFGPEFITSQGAIDRARMRQLVLGNPAARQKLQTVLHPWVRQEALRQAACSRNDWVVFDIPLLAESKQSAVWRQELHGVVVIDCKPETQIARVAKRPGWSAELAAQALAAQASRHERLAIADFCLYNDTLSLEDLTLRTKEMVAIIWRTFDLLSPL